MANVKSTVLQLEIDVEELLVQNSITVESSVHVVGKVRSFRCVGFGSEKLLQFTKSGDLKDFAPAVLVVRTYYFLSVCPRRSYQHAVHSSGQVVLKVSAMQHVCCHACTSWWPACQEE